VNISESSDHLVDLAEHQRFFRSCGFVHGMHGSMIFQRNETWTDGPTFFDDPLGPTFGTPKVDGSRWTWDIFSYFFKAFGVIIHIYHIYIYPQQLGDLC